MSSSWTIARASSSIDGGAKSDSSWRGVESIRNERGEAVLGMIQ